MKIAFFGTPDFTTDFLDTLSEHKFAPSLVITNPDRPSGRGMVLTAPAPKIWADKHQIQCLQPEHIDQLFIDQLKKESWDLFVVVAYGKIMPQALLDIPKYGAINVHYSLLPKYRGATPVESAILGGDKITGITIQQMMFKLDSGPILMADVIPICTTDTAHTLRTKLNAEALLTLPSIIGRIFANTITPLEQDHARATYCTKIQKSNGEIHLTDDPIELDRKHRAYDGWPGLYFYLNTTQKSIDQDTVRTRVKINTAHYEPSTNTFIIDEVTPENGKRISWEQFQK